MIRRTVALVVSLACCLALAACSKSGGGGDDPKTVDGIPAYATTNDAKGAQAFARYWVDTLNAATTSGNTKKLKTLQKSSCSTCADFAKQLDTIYGKGGNVKTDGFKVKKLATDGGIPKPGAGVSIVLTASPQTVVASKGAAPKKYPGGDARFRMIMVREGKHWVMDRIDVG